MNKPTIFLDCDNCIINSTRRLCDILNHRFKTKVKWQDVKKFNLTDQFDVSKEDVLDIFDSGNFWAYIEDYIIPDCRDVLTILSEDYDIIAVSIGSYNNISNKAQFLKEHFPMVKQFIGLASGGELIMDKSVLDMSGEGNYFIDDVLSNIVSSNCPNRILFSEDLLVNQWNGQLDSSKLVGSWMEILDIIQHNRKEKIYE